MIVENYNEKQVGTTVDVHIFSNMAKDMVMFKWSSRKTLIAMLALLIHFHYG